VHVLVRAVCRLAVRDDAEGGHDFSQWVRLQAIRRADTLLEERLVLEGEEDASNHTARHTEVRLKVTVFKDRRLLVDPNVVALDAEQARGEVMSLVWPTPSNRTALVATVVCVGGARPSSNMQQQDHRGFHRSANDGAIVLV